MSEKTIVILGGALAGPTAAARARETDEFARIILLERGADVNYAVGGLAYHLSGEVKSLRALNRERADFFRDVYRVQVRTGVEARAIRAADRVLELDDERLGYDALVVATGAESVFPDVPDLRDAENVFSFRTLGDLRGILACSKRGARRVAIVGGGFFGIEAADGFLRRGCRVTIVERGPRVLPHLGSTGAHAATAALVRAGATLLVDSEVTAVERRRNAVTRLLLRDGRSVKCDLVIVATGLRPRTDLLRRAGTRILTDGTVAVDERCATSLPDVYACGVCVSLPHASSGRPRWFAQAAQADKSAQVAGACAAGGSARMGTLLGTSILRVCDTTIARTGQAGSDAGFEADTVIVHAPSQDRFFPGSETVAIELTYHRTSGRLLGAEIASRAGVDKRIDVIATALLGGLTVEQLAGLDLAYAPPYSAARDPVNVAGAVATAARDGLATPWCPEKLARRPSGITLIDVRSEAEIRRGTLPKAIAIPLDALRTRLAGLKKVKPAVFLSETGRQGYLAARIARAVGWTEAGYLSGGLRSWLASGRPLTSKTASRS